MSQKQQKVSGRSQITYFSKYTIQKTYNLELIGELRKHAG